MHKGIDCEDRRTMEMFRDLGSRPLIMIRFNPDKYRDECGKSVNSCFAFDEKHILVPVQDEWQRRWSRLKGIIIRSLTTTPEKEVTIEYVFYDETADGEDKENKTINTKSTM